MKIYGTSKIGRQVLGFLMVPWVLVLVPMCHDLDLSGVAGWLSIPLAVAVPYAGRALGEHLARSDAPKP